MQTVLRELRALFRDPVMRRAMNSETRQRYSGMMISVAHIHATLGSGRGRPVYLRALRWVRHARSFVSEQGHPCFKFLVTFRRVVDQLLLLMRGDFSDDDDGVFSSSSCCCICLEGGGEGDDTTTTSTEWWRSSRCGHSFHSDCIAEHFLVNDARCPLCRGVC